MRLQLVIGNPIIILKKSFAHFERSFCIIRISYVLLQLVVDSREGTFFVCLQFNLNLVCSKDDIGRIRVVVIGRFHDAYETTGNHVVMSDRNGTGAVLFRDRYLQPISGVWYLLLDDSHLIDLTDNIVLLTGGTGVEDNNYTWNRTGDAQSHE